MEPSSLSMPFCLALLFILLSLFCLTAMKKKPSSPKLPPGPPKLPIVGNLHQLTNHPHRALRDLALKHGSLMYLKLGQIPTLVVSSRSMAEALMKTHDYNFASRPSLTTGNHLLYNCTDIAFAPAGAYWRTIRKICVQELLSVKRVESFSAVREEEVGRLVRAVESSEGAIDLNKLFLSHTIDVICRVAFGRRYDEGGPSEVERLFRERTVLLGGFNFGDLFPSVEWLDLVSGLRRRMRRAFEEIDEFLEHVLEDHRGGTAETQNQRDLVDVLLQLQKDASLDLPLSDQNLKAVLTDMFIAGTETTATALEWAMTELVRNPKVMEEVQNEVRLVADGRERIEEGDLHKLEYLQCVVKETLRLHPPVPLLLPRESLGECNINGYEIPARTRVMVNAWAIGRDPGTWGKNSEEFKPERFMNSSVDYKGTDFEFIPFGAGRRRCPGISFAMVSFELVLANLLLRFDWKLATGADVDMTEEYGLVLEKKVALFLIPIASKPSNN